MASLTWDTLLGDGSHCSTTVHNCSAMVHNYSATHYGGWTMSLTAQLYSHLLEQAQDGVAQRIQGARGLAVGDMTPGIHKTRHEPHHQRWPSPQDQAVHITDRRTPQDIV